MTHRSVISSLLVLALSIVVLIPAAASASTPAITLDPDHGVVGTSVTVTGVDFPMTTKGKVTFDGKHVARFRADRSGAFTIRFTVPERPDGVYDVVASTGTTSGTATAPFTLGTVTSPTDPSEPTDPSVGNPFANAALWVDPHSNARAEAANDPANAEVWNRIGDHAQADWFGDWYATDQVRQAAASRAGTIRADGALPVFVVYAIPQRDCGGYSAGGTNNPDAYRAWMNEFATGISGGASAVILEPDALAQLNCLATSKDRAMRLQLIKEAVGTLNAAGASVYIDAGNSAWIDSTTMSQRLIDAGIADARGFSTNVSNYRWSEDEIAYGTDVSSRTGGKPFVIDTSRNGLGPSTDPNDPEPWCNPPGRGLGARPTAATGNALVDAFLWIKRPGESDGTCKGGPAAGAWWPEYAFELATNAPWASTGQ